MDHKQFPQYAGRPHRPAGQYPLVDQAEAAQDRHPWFHLSIALALCVGIVLVVAGVIWQSATATPAADTAAHVVPATPRPGIPVPQPKPVEMSPPVPGFVAGDGTWLVGKEIKRATYQSAGGSSCYWSRLSDLSGELEAIIANSFGRNGKQVVALGADDAAFATQGCGRWELVK